MLSDLISTGLISNPVEYLLYSWRDEGMGRWGDGEMEGLNIEVIIPFLKKNAIYDWVG
ncbi:MAG: DUF4924 family protein [Okeania sp. SIO2F4]|nr:DUF4924 family protein [Okeania sp. SIO2F4]